MNFETFQMKFLEWTEKSVESKKSDGFSVCPYAKKARLENKIQFINAMSNTIDQLQSFDKEKFEIGIAWLGDNTDMQTVEYELEIMRQKNPDLLYFTSTPNSGYFVQNFTNCVFIQLQQDIMHRRQQLHTTKYYDSWPEYYYKLICG